MPSAYEHARRARGIITAADQESRRLTTSERREVEKHLALAEGRKALEADALTHGNGRPVIGDGTSGSLGATPGRRFVESEGFKAIQDTSSRPQRFSSGLIEVSDGPLAVKGTLTSTTAGGPGGGLVPPHYEPGIVDTLFEPLGVTDLFGQSAINAGQIRYTVEGTADSGAAGVAEGGEKPESELALSEVTEPIKKIATVTHISDELLEDAASVENYVNSRLALFIEVERERQILRGGGTNELVGVFDRGISVYERGTVDNNAIALLKAAAGVRGSAHVEPDGIIVHPQQWLSLRLLTDDSGQFLGGGPYQGQYGGNPQVSASQFTSAPIWGMRTVVSSVVGPGTALIGNFSRSAHIWRRGGVSVESTNSHSTHFVHNLSALRAEKRLGLGVYRPSAFVQVVDLD